MEKRGESVTVYTNFFFMDNNSPRFSLALITFSALYMLIAIMAAIRQGNTEFVFYIVVMAVLITSLGASAQKGEFFKRGVMGHELLGLAPYGRRISTLARSLH